jgi:hypothetical protein
VLYKNDIANLALGRLGVSLSIIDLETENTTQAKIIRRHFRMALDTLLEEHDWNFASSHQALALVTDYDDISDSGGWQYMYSLPANCLVLRELSRDGIFARTNQYQDEKEPFEEVYSSAGPRIYTDVPDAHGRFTVKLNDDIAFPTHFGRALAAQLSMDIAPSLITNNYGKVKETLNSSARSDIHLAIAHDMGRQPQRVDSASPFLRIRGA